MTGLSKIYKNLCDNAYTIGLKLLHLLPPETAHNVTLKALKLGICPKQYTNKPKQLFRRNINNAVGLAAGMDKNATALPAWQKMGFGFVEAGTVTLEPRIGSEGKRLWRMDNALINFMGLNNKGMEKVWRNIQAFKTDNMAVGVSITSLTSNNEELCQLTKKFADAVDYFSVNVACPNVAHKDAFINEALAQLPSVIENAKGKTVLVKLPPMTDEHTLRDCVKGLLQAGVSGFIATNTQPFVGHEKVLNNDFSAHWPTKQGKQVGGYSGERLLPITQKMVEIIRKEAGKDVIIIGVGGIQSAEDAEKVVSAGADAVQLYTGLVYKGPKLITEIAESL
jgi:dihydroorotate dehydrogenase